jgi:hypothetical protein
VAKPSNTTSLNSEEKVSQLNHEPNIDSGVILVNQECKPADVPDIGEGVNDLTRLNSAMEWAYEYSFQQIPPYAFGSALFFNCLENDVQATWKYRQVTEKYHQQFEKPDWSGDHIQFEIVEDTSGVTRTLEIQSNCVISEIEITKQGWLKLRPDLTRLGVSTNRYSINCSKDTTPGLIQIKLTGLDIRGQQKVRCKAWTNVGGADLRGARFTNDLIPLLSRDNVIRIDRLNDPEGEVRELEDHIKTLLTLLFFPPSTLNIKIECHYEYQIAPDVPKIKMPVIFVPPTTIDCPDQVSTKISNQLQRWYSEISPSKGTFIFNLIIFDRAINSQPLPTLHLTNLQLPVNSITTLSPGE